MGRSLTDTIRELTRTFANLRDEYRPELHYMRGPGPKWHAKRSGAVISSTPARAAATKVKALPDIAEARA